MSWFTKKSIFWRRLSLAETLMLLVAFYLFAAILIPVRGGSYRSRSGACLSNVKQLALMQIMYTADNDDRFPLRDNWMDSTKEYRKNDSIERCPTFADDEKAPKNLYGYAMNQAMSGAKIPPKPDTVPLIFESVNLARNASGTLDSLPNPGRHSGRNVIGYADGHAKAVDPNKP